MKKKKEEEKRMTIELIYISIEWKKKTYRRDQPQIGTRPRLAPRPTLGMRQQARASKHNSNRQTTN
jgi:hypothetical protein